ncbi:retrovirus-related pol polyprotein from transposon TNT 1-94 [Tanacetum coccineum]
MHSMIPTGQKNTLAEYMILVGADNRPPMLDKDLYDSWKSRMELYMQNREHGRMIFESVEHGPLIWPTIEENGVIMTKKYAELSPAEKIQADCDMKEINIILQGLPTNIYSFVNHHRVAKDLWEKVQLLMQGTSANTSRIGGNYSGQQRIVKCFNCQGEGHMARQCPKPKRKRDATWFREKVLLVEAQGNGKVLTKEELEFLADPGNVEGPVTQSVITHNAAYQANNLDAYDSNCDEISTAKAVLMANLSSYRSDVLFEVPISDNTNNDMLNQSVQEMPYSEPSHFVEHSKNEIHSDSNIILYSQYLIESQTAAVNNDNLIANETLSAELERYKERFADFEKEINNLKQTLSRQSKEKELLTKTFDVLKNESKEKEAKNIDTEIALEKKVKELDNIVCKMGQFAQTVHILTKPQVFYDNNVKQAHELSDEHALNPIINQSASLPVKIKARRELPKKQFLFENDRLLDQIISQDIVNIVVNSLLDENTSVNVNSFVAMNVSVKYVDMCCKCLDLEAELIKQHNMVEKDEYNRLLKRFSELEQHCISLEIAMQFNKEIFQKNNTSVNQTEPSFDQLFELNNLKAELQAKDTTIKKLKAHIKRVNETSTSENVKKDLDEIETINIELEHRVTKLITKNEHLKQTYKQLYDSIKPSRVHAKEQTESLVNQVNQKKLKGKDIVDNAAQMSNDATIALGMYKLDLVILAPKVKNNREAHEYYLKHTMEQAAILRGLIQELLGYIRDTCPDIHEPNEKLVAVTPINKKKIVRFADTITSSGNIPKVTNRPLLSSTRVKPSTSASGSKPSGNTKNDRISRTPSSNEKNKHLVKGAQALCSICNECLFDADHAMCLIDHVNSMNMRDKSAFKKIKKRKEWKPIGKVFNSVRYKWKPTGRTFTLVGNAYPLTRITAINKVPLRVPIPLEVVAPEHVVTRVYTRRPKVPKSVPNSKPMVAKSMTANRMKPGTSWGFDTLVAPTSSFLIDCRLSKLFCDLEVAFKKHTYFVRNLEGVDLLLGSRGTNMYSLSIGDMMASSPICLFSKATKTKSWLWHRRLSHFNFGALNHLARNGLVRGLPRLKFEKYHLCFACAMGKSKKQSHKPKSKDTNQEKLYLLHMDLCGPMRVASVNGKKYILVIVDDYSRFTWVKFLASKDATIKNIRTDNGTEFVNQTLRDYYEQVDISHETSVMRTPEQNGVVERRTVATTCYTKNRSIIRRHHGKTPYELIHDRKPDLSHLHVFCALCYPNNDSENLDKLQAKADIVPNPPPSALFVPPSRHEWDLVFQPVFDEFFSPPASVASPVSVEEAPAPVESTGSPSSTTVDQDAPSPKTVSAESSSSDVISTTVHSDAPIS